MSESRSGSRRTTWLLAITAISAVMVFLVVALLMSIFERKQEARNPYVRLVEVNEETTDPAAWGVNWAREYDDYKRTADVSRTRFGGSEALPAEKAKDFRGTFGRLVATLRPELIRILIVIGFAIVSVTFAVIGPVWSIVFSMGNTPVYGTNPHVGFIP